MAAAFLLTFYHVYSTLFEFQLEKDMSCAHSRELCFTHLIVPGHRWAKRLWRKAHQHLLHKICSLVSTQSVPNNRHVYFLCLETWIGDRKNYAKLELFRVMLKHQPSVDGIRSKQEPKKAVKVFAWPKVIECADGKRGHKYVQSWENNMGVWCSTQSLFEWWVMLVDRQWLLLLGCHHQGQEQSKDHKVLWEGGSIKLNELQIWLRFDVVSATLHQRLFFFLIFSKFLIWLWYQQILIYFWPFGVSFLSRWAEFLLLCQDFTRSRSTQIWSVLAWQSWTRRLKELQEVARSNSRIPCDCWNMLVHDSTDSTCGNFEHRVSLDDWFMIHQIYNWCQVLARN